MDKKTEPQGTPEQAKERVAEKLYLLWQEKTHHVYSYRWVDLPEIPKNQYRLEAEQIHALYTPLIEKARQEGWELQDSLLNMTVLSQNSPKIILTNDEAGWYATYLPNPPMQDNRVQVLGDDPLDAVRKLKKALGL